MALTGDPLMDASVQEIIEDTLSFCIQRMRQYAINLRVPTISPASRVGCKPAEISQVPLNLLNNAVDAVHSLPEKWIELPVTEAGNFWEIAVTDSRRGIPPPNIRKKMGQPFLTTKEVGKGTVENLRAHTG